MPHSGPSQQRLHITLSSLAAASCLLLGPGVAGAQAFAESGKALVDYTRADLTPRRACADLGAFKGKDIVAVQATEVAASAAAPAYCRVTGTITPEVAFEVALPAKWNGRFYMIGNGGHAGESLEDPGRTGQRDAALKLGFAFAQTNTGHDSRKEAGGTFVLSNPQKAIDYAYRAVHVTASTAKDIVRQHYDRPASRAYWNSCSNGGRQGLLEAQRYQLMLEAQQRTLADQAARLDAEVENRRQAVVEADRQVRVLDKLRERRAAEHRAAAERAESKRLDDVAAVQWGNRRS